MQLWFQHLELRGGAAVGAAFLLLRRPRLFQIARLIALFRLQLGDTFLVSVVGGGVLVESCAQRLLGFLAVAYLRNG